MNNEPTNKQITLEKALKKHYGQKQLPDFSGYLFNRIISKIDYQKRLAVLKPRLWAAMGFFITSVGLLVAAFIFSWHAFAQTPNAKYFSLIFTDFGQVLANWQDYSYSILESLPLGATAILLSAFLAAIWLIDFGSHQVSNFRKLTNTQNYGNK